MSSEMESPELEESPANTEKAAGGRRNPRRSTRNANPIKSEDSPETRKPSRKGSEARVTRSRSNRSRKKSGSPTFRSSKGGSVGTDSQESPAARVKSSRRASSRVNYKESEGEEDTLPELPKEEDDYKSDDDWEDSEGEGKKKKEASPKRTPAKSRRSVGKDSRSRTSRSANKRSERSKRGKKDETEEESNKEDDKSDEKEASVDKKDSDEEEEAKKTLGEENEIGEDKEINKEPTENQEDEIPPSDNKEQAESEPEKKEKPDTSSQESSTKRKLEEEEEARKKPKLDTEVVKSNESSYHRSSPVIVENKQFSEASKETPMEVDTNAQDSSTLATTTTNETSTQQNDSTEHLSSHSLEPSINGSTLLTKPTHTQSIPGSNGTVTPERLYITNPSLSPEKIERLRPYTFTMVSYNLQGPDSTLKENSCANEIKNRKADIVCLQSITSSFFSEKIQSISRELGYHDVMTDGLALLYKPNMFELVSNSPISLHSLIQMDLEGKPAGVVEAVMKYLKDLCCKAYVVELRSLLEGSHLLRLCNVALPALLDPSYTTLLMCRLLKEINSSPDLPHILCGEFNPVNWVSQVLVTGYISEELDQEMRRRKDIFLSNEESISLFEVLPNLHSSTSLQYTNCYTTVMGSQKSSGGSEQVWASANSLSTLGVWEPTLALQARLAFSE